MRINISSTSDHSSSRVLSLANNHKLGGCVSVNIKRGQCYSTSARHHCEFPLLGAKLIQASIHHPSVP